MVKWENNDSFPRGGLIMCQIQWNLKPPGDSHVLPPPERSRPRSPLHPGAQGRAWGRCSMSGEARLALGPHIWLSMFCLSFHLRHSSEAGYIVIPISQVRRPWHTKLRVVRMLELRFAPQALMPGRVRLWSLTVTPQQRACSKPPCHKGPGALKALRNIRSLFRRFMGIYWEIGHSWTPSHSAVFLIKPVKGVIWICLSIHCFLHIKILRLIISFLFFIVNSKFLFFLFDFVVFLKNYSNFYGK